MPLSSMGDWGNALGGAVTGVGGALAGFGTPGQDMGSWVRGLRQNQFEALPRDRQFAHLKSLYRDIAQSAGKKLKEVDVSNAVHNYVRTIQDLGTGHGDAYSQLRQELADIKDKQVQAPQGFLDPKKTGESVYAPNPNTLDPALTKQNAGDAFRRALDPMSGVQTDPAGQGANEVLTGNISAERQRRAWTEGGGQAPTTLGSEFPVNLIQGLNLPKKQLPGESGQMMLDPHNPAGITDRSGNPLQVGAYQNPFFPPPSKPKSKGSKTQVAADPVQEEAAQYGRAGGKNTIPWIAAEAFKRGLLGQAGIAAGAGTQAGELTGQGKQGPTIGRMVFEQSVLQPYAAKQRDTLMQVADLYDRYANWKGKGKPKNPLTALGLTRSQLGIGVGDVLNGDAIRRFASEKYGDPATGRPGWFLTDPARKGSAFAVQAAGLKKIQAAQKQGVSYGAGTQGGFTGDYLDQISQGGFPSGNELTQDPNALAQSDPRNLAGP